VASSLGLFRQEAAGFIDWLDEHCPNSLWWTTDAAVEKGETLVSAATWALEWLLVWASGSA